MKLYNTLSRKVEEFVPIKPGKVGMYICGPTVYDYSHIGHSRTYVNSDVLIRVLRWLNFQVKSVMNITDVGHLTSNADEGEDKMEKKARTESKNIL
ncbi:cysteine--tRNA ligase, partial [Patescibacteria group bacterium]|nr:cysteine--tRNA ligase [Patescibacteria group bacterium]